MVSGFIKKFHNSELVDVVFSNGCCYWFAWILYSRFFGDGAEIMYDQIANHFGTRINGIVYDITGDVTKTYNWVTWASIDDESHKKRIIRDCILFTDSTKC